MTVVKQDNHLMEVPAKLGDRGGCAGEPIQPRPGPDDGGGGAMNVTVEYSLEEAEALMKRLAPDPHPSMSAAECSAVEICVSKLDRAVQIERGSGGTAATRVPETVGVRLPRP